MNIDPLDIIKKFYDPAARAYKILVEHGTLVGGKALEIARCLPDPDLDTVFLEEAAMLHDIGMFLTDAPMLDCHGKDPYVCHGVLGSRLLLDLGLARHARVCESHVGVGLCAEDIRVSGLPLPRRDMLPETLEEQIICYADKFYSKNGNGSNKEKSIEEILSGLIPHGKDKVKVFSNWVERFRC